MKKTIVKILSYVLVAVIAAGTTAIGFGVQQLQSTDKLQQVQSLLERYFIGDIDEKKLEDAAASAMVDALGDQWSYYMTAEQFLSYKEYMTNSYVGVGITVRNREDRQGIDVVAVTDGGPAQEAGILPGDILVSVDGNSILGMDANDLTGVIRGEEGAAVKLTVKRGQEQLEYTITRKKFQTPVATYQMLEDKIGLITIENFDERCAEETIAAIEALVGQGAEALVFDVRNNPGGYKTEMLKILDYLLPEGPLFRSVDYQGREQVDYSDASYLDIPMAVVVNLRSYSAAEFFAAALDEYDAAMIVGEKTYGKGHFQNTFQLSDGSAVNLSVGKYTTPNGKSLVGVGLTPEVEVVVDNATAEKIAAGILDPAEDPQIIAAINALKG